MREARLTIDSPGRYRLHGDWRVRELAPVVGPALSVQPDADGLVVLEAEGMTGLDTAGAWVLVRCCRLIEEGGGRVDLAGLDDAHRRLVEVVRTHLPREAPLPRPRLPFLDRVGEWAVEQSSGITGFLVFLGRLAITLLRSISLRGRIYWREILHVMETAGANALPIVALLSFLIGVVIAYQGVTQLSRYGANIFVVDLVAISVLRELSPLVTAIIVAGRTGSAFTAEIGAMKITEEIDALRVLGISPTELLVLPKIMALVIVLPLLTVVADIAGVVGGMLMAQAYGGISSTVFIDRFPEAVVLSDYVTGIAKTPVFAAIIGAIGCYQGFQVSHGADSVGRQTTVSVVQSIFMVIVVDAAFSVVFSALEI